MHSKWRLRNLSQRQIYTNSDDLLQWKKFKLHEQKSLLELGNRRTESCRTRHDRPAWLEPMWIAEELPPEIAFAQIYHWDAQQVAPVPTHMSKISNDWSYRELGKGLLWTCVASITHTQLLCTQRGDLQIVLHSNAEILLDIMPVWACIEKQGKSGLSTSIPFSQQREQKSAAHIHAWSRNSSKLPNVVFLYAVAALCGSIFMRSLVTILINEGTMTHRKKIEHRHTDEVTACLSPCCIRMGRQTLLQKIIFR